MFASADLEFDLVLAQAYAHAIAIEADLWLLLKKVGGYGEVRRSALERPQRLAWALVLCRQYA
jgi:hypothetical protein